MGNFKRYLGSRCTLRGGDKDFCFVYHANQTYPSAYIMLDDMLVFNMNGEQIGSVNDNGFFFRIDGYSTPVAFYDSNTDCICDSKGGGFVGVVDKNSYPFFNLSRPTFPFDFNGYRIYNNALSNGTGPTMCSGQLSNRVFLELF